jgi:hypothetical protein
VRDAVARHLAAQASPGAEATGLQLKVSAHPGFHRYALARGDDGDGACLIEPKVRCNHCGFCQSHGF